MNKPAILALSPLLAAVAFEATLLAAGFCSGRLAGLAPTRSERIAPADRQFLTALEEQGRKESEIAMADRALLAELQVNELELVPRATFVAPPRSAPLVASESATSEMPEASATAPLIPRATFVAPPRFASQSASDSATPVMQSAQTMPVRRAEAVNGAPNVAARRSSIIIFNGKVFITRPTVMN